MVLARDVLTRITVSEPSDCGEWEVMAEQKDAK
jgi:hypothetical protein